MRLVFMGTPAFAASILEELAWHHEIVGVFCAPDAVRGRGKALVPCAVKEVAQRIGAPVHEPKSLRGQEPFEVLAALQPDAICVAAYGCLLPKQILDLPRYGCLNVHASLLPRWRGAAPIERALLAGDETMGVCIMRMEEGLDTGDYCVARSVPADDGDFAFLTDELASLGAQALLSALVQIETGNARWTIQDEALATYAEKIGKHELDISPALPMETCLRHVRAASAAHPCHAMIGGRDCMVVSARRVDDLTPSERRTDVYSDCDQAAVAPLDSLELRPGEAKLVRKRLCLGCADGMFEVLKVKPSGKSVMDAAAFVGGMHLEKGAVFAWGAKDDASW